MSTRNSLERCPRITRPRAACEPLETRRLLSVSLGESEPNNSRAKADVIERAPGELVTVNGATSTPADHDWFKIDLEAGDVLGVAVTGASPDDGGLDPYARLLDASGTVVVENSGPNFYAGDYLPAESPLPRADPTKLKVELYRVTPKSGTHYLDVSSFLGESSGEYQVELMVARPGTEAAPRGTRQVLFLDFDGATVDYGDFNDAPADQATLSPMRDFLEGFNLSPDDEGAVIDGVVGEVTRLLSDDVERYGRNGDYDRSGRAGEFDLEVRNSRDHADTFGDDPFVSRVVIGGTYEEAGFVGDEWAGAAGLAASLDVGNFDASEQAVATLEWIVDGSDFVSAAAPFTQLDVVVKAVADLAAHEAGHIFGAFHTDDDPEGTAKGFDQLMDPYVGEFIGPDFVFGTDDDLDLGLGVGAYQEDVFSGVNDTLNTIAFGLSTGKAAGDHDDNAASGGPGRGDGRRDVTGLRSAAAPADAPRAAAIARAGPPAPVFSSTLVAPAAGESAWSRLAAADSEDGLPALI